MLRERLLEVRPVVCVERGPDRWHCGEGKSFMFFEGRVELGSRCPN